MRYWLTLALSLLCLTSYAEEKRLIPLPKAHESAVESKQHIFMLQKLEASETKVSQEPEKKTFKQVRCTLSSRYRTCF